MGNFKYPAFISYSSLDNARWADWLDEFRTVFERGLAAELRVQGMESAPVFFDVEALNGKSDTVDNNLLNAINSSFALFIFLGKGYLESRWCLEELKMFSRSVGSARDVLNKRVWIFELECLDDQLKSRFEERLAEAEASVLKNQRRQIFVDPKTRKRPVLKRGDGSIDQGAYQEKVEPLVNALVAAIHSSPFQQPMHPSASVDVLIAAPTWDLEGECEKLATMLKDAKWTCERVSEKALDELNDDQLRNLFSGSRAVVLPVSEAKVYMRRAISGGHLATQMEALQAMDVSRVFVWRPNEGQPLQDSDKEWEDRHLHTVKELLGRARSEGSVPRLAEAIGACLKKIIPVDDESAIVILCESRDGVNLLDDEVVQELSRQWETLSPSEIRNAQVVHMKLNVDNLRKNQRLLNGDAVVVFRDETEDLTNSKCRIIARNMGSWLRKRTPLQPGLIVEREGDADTMVVHYWPKARFTQTQRGDPPRPIGAFADGSQGSLQRFLRSIASLKG